MQKNPSFIDKPHIIPFHFHFFSLVSLSSIATVSFGSLESSSLIYAPGGMRRLGEGKKIELFFCHQHFPLCIYKIEQSTEDFPNYKTETCFILTAIQMHYVSCLILQPSIPYILHFINPCISFLSSALLFQNSSLKLMSFLT